MSELRELTIELHKKCCPLCNNWHPSEYSSQCGFNEDETSEEVSIYRYFEKLALRAELITQETDIKMDEILEALSLMAQRRGKEVPTWLRTLIMAYGFNEYGGISGFYHEYKKRQKYTKKQKQYICWVILFGIVCMALIYLRSIL